jgi:hypothetical protein
MIPIGCNCATIKDAGYLSFQHLQVQGILRLFFFLFILFQVNKFIPTIYMKRIKREKNKMNYFQKRGILGRMVTVADLKSFAPHQFVFKFCQGHWTFSCHEAFQLNFGRSADLLRCPLVLEIIHEGAPEVLLRQYSWKSAVRP